MALIVWTLSGLTAWAGAASFAELGAAIPINGGMQEYLKYVYGDYVASLASWIWILAVKPSSMANPFPRNNLGATQVYAVRESKRASTPAWGCVPTTWPGTPREAIPFSPKLNDRGRTRGSA